MNEPRIYINDNNGSLECGDVIEFRSAVDAAEWMEPSDVANGAYIGVFDDGGYARIFLLAGRVHIERDETIPSSVTLRDMYRDAASHRV